MADRLEDARDMLDRADEQLEAIDNIKEGYLAEKPYRIVGQIDPKGFEYVAQVYILKEPPKRLGILIGECVHSLRVGLDYLAYALATPSNAGDPVPGTEFPIFDDPTLYKAIDKKKGLPARGSGLYKVRGMDSTVQTVIEGLQPYHRVSDPHGHELWIIHTLDIVAKHRKRHVTGTILEGASMGINTLYGFDIDIVHVGPLAIGPFVNGTVIAKFKVIPTRPNPQMEMNFKATFDVAFNPKGPARGEPVIACLSRLRDFVRRDVFPQLEVFV